MLNTCARMAILAGVVAAIGVARPGGASAQGLDLRIRQGYDTNVFKAATAVDSVRVDGPYSQLRVAYERRSVDGGRYLFLRPQAEVRWYPQSASANQYGAEVVAGFRSAWRNPTRGARWFRSRTTQLQVSGGYERALFLKRQTREEFQQGEPIAVGSIPATELPSRVELAGELRVESEVRKDWTVEAGVLLEWNDYTDGGASVTRSFERLDGREFGLFTEWAVKLGSNWEVGAGIEWSDRVYPNREARDAEGQTVEGETRHYWQWEAAGSAAWSGERLENELELEYGRRDDRFAGYYSYDAWEVGDRVRIAPTPSMTVELRYAYGRKAYDVYGETGTPTRNRYHDAEARLYTDLSGAVQLVFGSAYERTVSNDPLFDYRRLDLFAEVRVRR